jgi:hypothetical protein
MRRRASRYSRRLFLKLGALAVAGLVLMPAAALRRLHGLVIGDDGTRYYYLQSWTEKTPWLDGPVTFVFPFDSSPKWESDRSSWPR